MKKTLLIVALILAALAAVGAGTVFAQDAQPPFNGGGRGPMMGNGGAQGPLHTFMTIEFAKALKLNVNDINTRVAAGETMRDIALSTGMTAEEFPAVMTEVRGKALDAAVKANVITQEQADLMKSRGFGQGGGMGNGTGNCDGTQQGMRGQGGGGMMGQGQGQGRGMMGGGCQNQQVNP